MTAIGQNEKIAFLRTTFEVYLIIYCLFYDKFIWVHTTATRNESSQKVELARRLLLITKAQLKYLLVFVIS